MPTWLTDQLTATNGLLASLLGVVLHFLWSRIADGRRDTILRWVSVAVRRASAAGLDWRAVLDSVAPHLHLSDTELRFAELVAHEVELEFQAELRRQLRQLGDAAAEAGAKMRADLARLGPSGPSDPSLATRTVTP